MVLEIIGSASREDKVNYSHDLRYRYSLNRDYNITVYPNVM